METPSLLQHFNAPDNFQGCFGFFCGYSADAEFLDLAAERFTRQNKAQRTHNGLISMALMLDPGHPRINLTEIPGVAHLQFANKENKPFFLMHAKVAILGFKGIDDPSKWFVRLIVSTGNWTVQTVEESLDLFVSIDCTNNGALSITEIQQNCADIKAAWEMLSWLMDHYDCRILSASVTSQKLTTSHSMELVKSWILAIQKVAKDLKPRFFCSKNFSLQNQLIDQVKHHAGQTKRNYIAMGSGFFEGGGAANRVPSTLKKIKASLAAELLTKDTVVEIYVNPSACQAVALNLEAMIQEKYVIRESNTPPEIFGQQAKRILHAKFIFSANKTSKSSKCNRPWVYIGSGNLTAPGFINPMSKDGGNLEAGMLIVPDELYWDKNSDSCKWVENLLPIHKEGPEITSIDQLQTGDEMEIMDEATIIPPIVVLYWTESDNADRGLLFAKTCIESNPEFREITVLDINEKPCALSNDKQWIWQGTMPRSVKISWKEDSENQTAEIPVMDQFGRLAASELQALDIEDAMLHLMNFPYSGIDEDVVDGAVDDATHESNTSSSNTNDFQSDTSYPIRKMMTLLEQIAKQQVEMHPLNWRAWCARLEQTLLQMHASPVIAEFVRLEINPIKCLVQPSFRPNFSIDPTSAIAHEYDLLVRRISEKWGVHEFQSFGETE